MREFEIRTIGVIGIGLIGASLLKDIKNHQPQINRLGYSLGHELVIVQKQNLIKPGDLQKLIDESDLIFISTPISDVIKTADIIYSQKKSTKRLLVTDVASVKSDISNHFNMLNSKKSKTKFISSHPMGGSEKTGYDHSRGGLFRQKPWIICNDDKVDIQMLDKYEQFIKKVCGPRTVYLNADVHDKYIAAISHFILDISSMLFDFVSNKHPESLKLAGDSFISTTRLASDNPEMLASININNIKNIKPVAKEFIRFMEKKIESEDLNYEYFNNNKKARDSWLHHRNIVNE